MLTEPSVVRIAFVTQSIIVITSRPACAYIDPGTGSYVLQAIVASLLAAAFVLKTTWRSIKEALSRKNVKSPEDAD